MTTVQTLTLIHLHFCCSLHTRLSGSLRSTAHAPKAFPSFVLFLAPFYPLLPASSCAKWALRFGVFPPLQPLTFSSILPFVFYPLSPATGRYFGKRQVAIVWCQSYSCFFCGPPKELLFVLRGFEWPGNTSEGIGFKTTKQRSHTVSPVLFLTGTDNRTT